MVGEACSRIQEGSGFVVGADLVATNAHVVAGERETEVQRFDGRTWHTAADQSGEVQTLLQLPSGPASIVTTRTGQQQWRWRANFEAFDPFPAGAGSQVVDGTYRFVVDGRIRQAGQVAPYHLVSQPFTVSPWGGIQVTDVRADPGGAVSFVVPPIAYPRTPATTWG